MTSIKKGETKRNVVPSGSRCMETVIPTPLLHVMIKVVGWNWVIKASQLIHTPLLENCNAHTTFHFPVYFVTDVYLKQAKQQAPSNRHIYFSSHFARRNSLHGFIDCCVSKRNSFFFFFFCKTRSIYEVNILNFMKSLFHRCFRNLFIFFYFCKGKENVNLILTAFADG